MSIPTSTSLDYLLPYLRLHLGDIDSTSYRYLDEWLRVALVQSVKELQRWWADKYLIDGSTYVVSRNSNWTYDYDSPPVIQHKDEEPIILMASLLIKGGSLEANSWNAGSWRDAEFSVSNIEGSRAKEASFKLDWDKLTEILTPPSKKLTFPFRASIYGAEETNT